MSYVLAGLIGAILALVALGWWIRRQRAALLRRGAGSERVGDRRSPARGLRASMLAALRDPIQTTEGFEARERELGDDVRGYLGDVAAQHGADDAMLFARGSDSAPFLPVAWNHPGAPSAVPWGTEQQRGLVAWAAGEGVVSFDRAEDPPSLAAARVPLEWVVALGPTGQAGGALVLHAEGGIRGSRTDLKVWLPRHAQRLAQLVELQVTRNEVARQNRRMRALMRNAQELQVTGEQEELERGIAESVLDASGATFAALVAWNPDVRRGAVRHATKQYPDPAPLPDDPVEPESLVGGVCLDGTQRLWEDASAVAGVQMLYSPAARVPDTASLAILPLQRAKITIGALVIGAREKGVIRPSDLRTVHLIAQLAASALEAAWEIEEVSRRSRTDQLTGLWNRRHFDEELRRALDQTDRFGGTCARVVADVDRFKVVNDTYGHEAGDAGLRRLAGVTRDLVRTTDVCARIGGEEICVILPQTSLGGALELAERLRAHLEASVVGWRTTDIRVTASFGVATYHAGAGLAMRAKLFETADRAMYRAKRDGRNCVRSES